MRTQAFLSPMMLLEMVVTSAIVENSTLSIAHLLLDWEVVKWKGFLSIFSLTLFTIPITQFSSFTHSLSYLFHQSNDFHPKKKFTRKCLRVCLTMRIEGADMENWWMYLKDVLHAWNYGIIVGKILLIEEEFY